MVLILECGAVQELATVSVDKLPTKIFILNNQHLGMVVQWEDRFYKANRAHTYLGKRVSTPPGPTHAHSHAHTDRRSIKDLRSMDHSVPQYEFGNAAPHGFMIPGQGC